MKPRSAGPFWFHVTSSKVFAKRVVGRALRLSERQAKECVARAAGFEGVADALARPRTMDITFDEWVRRLEETLAVDAEELLPRAELLSWYQKLFVTHQPMCLGPALRRSEGLQVGAELNDVDDASEDRLPVPASVNHAQTVVDAIAGSGGQEGIRWRQRRFNTKHRT